LDFRLLQRPFMTCNSTDPVVDISQITLSISTEDASQTSIVGVVNPAYIDMIIEDLKLSYGDDYDFSNFIIPPITSVDTNLKVTLVNANTIEIEGGIIGFGTIRPQQVNFDRMDGVIQMSSILDENGPTTAYNCSILFWVLKSAFKL
jgi:hypothetical protein